MNSANDNGEIELIEGTIRDIEEAIDRLKEQKKFIDEELREKGDRLLAWKTRLTALQSGQEMVTKTKRRKGENLRAIMELFAKQPGRGLSMSEVQHGLNISWSSVRAVLKNKKEIFFEKGDLWYMKEDTEMAEKNGEAKRIAAA